MMEILTKVVRLAEKLGASQAEAYFLQRRTKRVKVEKSKFKMVDSRTSAGVGIRVLFEGRLGFAYSTSLSEEELEKAVKKAISVARVREEARFFKSFAPACKYPEVSGLYCKETAEVSLDELAATIARVVDACKSYSNLVTAVNANIGVGVEEKAIVNSLGLEASVKSTGAGISVSVTAEKGKLMSTSFDFQSCNSIKELNCEEVALNAAKFSIKLLEGKKAGLLKVPIILDPIAVAVLVASILSYAMSAENVQAGRSFLKGLLNQEVASSGFTLVDDPLIEGGVASRPFDDEGVPSRKLIIIENGVLKSYLHNLFTAYRENVETTGHASRDYASEPSIRPSNLIFAHKCEKPLNDLVSEIEKGVYIRFIIGAHTFNRATGDFSVVASEALLIEKGEIGTPIRQAAFSGNLLELLKKTYANSREKKWIGSICTGALAVKEATITS